MIILTLVHEFLVGLVSRTERESPVPVRVVNRLVATCKRDQY